MSQSESSAVEELVLWSTTNGSYLDSRVEIYFDAVSGLSFRASQDIPAGVSIVSCTYKITLSYLNAIEVGPLFGRHGSPPFVPASLDSLGSAAPHIVGNFFLMQQYLLGPASFWWQYIKNLPQPGDTERLDTPMWWSDADLMYLRDTNAQPAIKEIRDMWYNDWKRGCYLIYGFANESMFNENLYKWAASIFATRGFRASLTIPRALVLIESRVDLPVLLEHLEKDHFSILLPVMDIGNHNGINQVQWIPDDVSGYISLANLGSLRQGTQVYNFYGDKSNSELLVGYGFVLPTRRLDTVNLKLCPPADAMETRRGQACYTGSREKTLIQEVLFQVLPCDDGETSPVASVFSPGLIDLLSCMVANSSERNFLRTHPACCLEHADTTLLKTAGRMALQTWLLLCRKLRTDAVRLQSSGQLLRYLLPRPDPAACHLTPGHKCSPNPPAAPGLGLPNSPAGRTPSRRPLRHPAPGSGYATYQPLSLSNTEHRAT